MLKHEPTYFVLLRYRHNIHEWASTDICYGRDHLIADLLRNQFDHAGIAEVREFDGNESFRDVSAEIAAQLAKYETDVGATLPDNVRKFCEAHGVLAESAA